MEGTIVDMKKNKLNKRYFRELKSDFSKYLVLFVFVVGMVAIVSGFLVATDSITVATDGAFDKYNIEDGNFEVSNKLEKENISNIEKGEVKLVENFYIEEKTKEVESTIRVFTPREYMNKSYIFEGSEPQKTGQIAVDRVYAKNNKLEMGDTLSFGDKEFEITGIVALTDYAALYSDNSDMMFDSKQFGVGIIGKEDFEALGTASIHYNYSWSYEVEETDEVVLKEMGDDFLKVVAKEGVLVNYIPAYLNQAIYFARNDIGADSTIFQMFLYIIIAILGFVTALTTSATIAKEANIIGTLRALGYSRNEVLLHYTVLPVGTIIVGTIIGNIVGYTSCVDFMASNYYNSFSLPGYTVRWNAEAFINTSVIPSILLTIIVVFLLYRKLSLSPLKFIRRDLTKAKNKNAIKLSTKLSILTRFRLRIIFQNIPNYCMIFIGALFANLIILFGFLFNPMLEKYSDSIIEKMISNYQYILKAPIPTDEPEAEIYCITSLHDINSVVDNEDILVFGVEEDSRYIDIPKDKVYVSNAYSLKYDIGVGDEINLKAIYEDEEYTIQVDGIYEYPASLAIFMDINKYREMFDVEESYFSGYFTNNKIEDIEKDYIATIITRDDLVKVSRQLEISMGNMMILFSAFGFVVFILLIYLLTKVVIDKNSQNISLTKILGYSNKDINKLYIGANTIVTLVALIVTIYIDYNLIKMLCDVMFKNYAQYIPFYMPKDTIIKTAILGVVGYGIVAFFLTKKAKKIPLEEALKNIE